MVAKSALFLALTTVVAPNYVFAYSTIASLPTHTVYTPQSGSGGSGPYPVILWGNGGCRSEGTLHEDFLQTLCNAGYIAIASGAPGKSSLTTTADIMTAALTWVLSTSQDHDILQGKMDTSNITVAGHSCGGGEAESVAVANPDKIRLLGLYSSGFGAVPKVPTFLVTGGHGDTSLNIPIDLAYSNAHNLYPEIQASKWIGDLESVTINGVARGVGHDGTFWLKTDGHYTGGEYSLFSIILFNYWFKGSGKLSDLNRPGWENIQSMNFVPPGSSSLSNSSAKV